MIVWAGLHTTAPPLSELWNHTAGAVLGRYVNLCQMGGDTPSHFTGGIRTFDSHDSFEPYSYDYRDWVRRTIIAESWAASSKTSQQ